MPLALLMTMPPTMAEFFDAGSGENVRPSGAKISSTLCPTMPGCRVMVSESSLTLYRSQFLPATIRMLSVTVWPLRLVPAARKVTGKPISWAVRSSRDTSCSFLLRTTTCGRWR